MLEELSVSIFRVLFYRKTKVASFSTVLVPTLQPVSVKFQTNVIFMYTAVLTSNLTLDDYLIHKGTQSLFMLRQDPPHSQKLTHRIQCQPRDIIYHIPYSYKDLSLIFIMGTPKEVTAGWAGRDKFMLNRLLQIWVHSPILHRYEVKNIWYLQQSKGIVFSNCKVCLASYPTVSCLYTLCTFLRRALFTKMNGRKGKDDDNRTDK
jgi:hypothetical protein